MLTAQNSLGIIFFPAFDWAISPTHPEREERLLYTQDQFMEEGVFDIEGIEEYKPLIADQTDVERTHFCFPDVISVATRSHLISAGGAIRAAKLVMEGVHDKAFALVRPPGHHAMKVVHGSRGFCNINIEAVMIEWIRETYGRKRIAVVDTDCHHGDGTQDIYWHDPDVLFISLHQDGRTMYPGTGFPHESGGPKARGRTINIPLPPHTGEEGFLQVLDDVILPILDDFGPDIVINSAGQDNHYSDPITTMNFTAQGYARLNERLNPDIAVLEGGYSIQGALPYVNLGISLAMAGLDYAAVREPDYDPDRLRQDPKLNEYLAKLCEQLPNLYFAPTPGKAEKKDGWFHRHKAVFYDTDQINEDQDEYLYDCPDCRGVLRIESVSTTNPRSFGVEAPVGACEKCVTLAHDEYERAGAEGEFRYLQLIDRVGKIYERIGYDMRY